MALHLSPLEPHLFYHSGVAGMVVAISCCAAVAKLGNGPYFSFSIEDVMVELMDHSHSLVSVERLHNLATEAGFEVDFLSHFGRKVLLSNKSEEVEFWIGLAHKKLSTAFSKESVIPRKQNFHDKVSAVGHAAMLAAINKYMPGLIPSPYSSARLDVVKQLKRSKKMEVIACVAAHFNPSWNKLFYNMKLVFVNS